MTAAEAAARALGHPVLAVLPGGGGQPVVAASVVGDPPQTRLAWVDPVRGSVLARVACPPGRPSRPRPVVATAVTFLEPDRAPDRVLVGRVVEGVAAMRPVLAAEEPEPDAPVGAGDLALARVPSDVLLVAVDAVDPGGEAVGRLLGAGVAHLQVAGGSVSGRLGLSHGMAAGIGPGRWAADLEEAAFEAGYELWLPDWLPPGLERRALRLEPDAAYPAAPSSVVIAWTGAGEPRVLLRQAPAPLASPDPGGRGAREVAIGEASGVLRGRWMPTLVWETPVRAFGLQVRRLPDAEAVALRVARSVRPPREPPER
jgi:hypothetical protein